MTRAGSAYKLADLAADRTRALALTPVSRETAARLDGFVELLLTWQRRTNLIAQSTVSQLWTRHVADSLQLLALAPQARRWIDLGSGAGFPGLVLAIALADAAGAAVDLVESNTKKAAFLREAQRLTGAPARVHLQRIEDFAASFGGHADIVTARAVAPLKSLLRQSFPLLGKSGATGLFPKGQRAELELEDAAALMKSANMTATLAPSRTDPAGRIVVIRVEQGPTAP